MSAEVRIATRGSALALVQAELARAALQAAGQPVRIVIVETAGDRRGRDMAWGEGAFVAAIEDALLDDRADVAVHSAKDVPTDEDPRLTIAAYLERGDARDALVLPAGSSVRTLDDLPAGARIGTDSPRRTGFVLAARPDLVLHPLHGNVDTRLRRLDDGETDALVLACAGLDRLGRSDRIAARLGIEVVPPAPGQGAIALQVRADADRLIGLLAGIDHLDTRISVTAERAFLRATGGGCRSPIGAFATVRDGHLELFAGGAAEDGSWATTGRLEGLVAESAELGQRLATELDLGAMHVPVGGIAGGARPRVLVTRAAVQARTLVTALRNEGLEPVLVPGIAIEPVGDRGPIEVAASRLSDYRWVVVTSVNGARAILGAQGRTLVAPDGPRWAAIGDATRSVLESTGAAVSFTPSRPSAATLAAELPIEASDPVLVVQGDLASAALTDGLRARGAVVDAVTAYRTREAPDGSRELLRTAWKTGPPAAIAFTSGSTVRGLVTLGAAESIDVTEIPALCIGEETTAAARAAGFRVLAAAPSADAAALAQTAAAALRAQLQEIR